MFVERELAEVGKLARIPQPVHRIAVRAPARATSSSAARWRSASESLDWPRLHQPARRRRFIQAREQRIERTEIAARSCAIAERAPARSDGLRCARRSRRRAASAPPVDAKRAVVHVAAGAARDLADLFRPQRAHASAVEFLQRGERDMIDIHVDAHADGIGRDQKIDIAD